jgi:citrate lyase beta subunit
VVRERKLTAIKHPHGFDSQLAKFRRGEDATQQATDRLKARLPLRYLRQQAHLVVPASDVNRAEKAVTSAAPMAGRLLDRYGISPEALADRLAIPVGVTEIALSSLTTPLVVLDLEDGVPPPLVHSARKNAIALFKDADWNDSLRFFRPAGVGSGRCAEDLVSVLTGALEAGSPDAYPIDGLVFPKVRHPHEVKWLYQLLSEVEADLGLPRNRIRVIFQIETGWALQNLRDLASVGIERLAGLVLGTVDLAADLLLPEVRYRHTISEWARCEMVTVAGATGVPSIDGMTMEYPVPLSGATIEANRAHILQRIAESFDDAKHSINMGMAGRWVGHPLQLLATLLAFHVAYSAEALEADIALVESFAQILRDDQGAVAGPSGQLLDIGTDRHLRNRLRRAAAWSLVSQERALALGLISEDEVATRP